MRYLIYFLFLLTVVKAPAQQVKGTVFSNESKPIHHAQVTNLRSGSHAHTDGKGSFLIETTTPGDTLKVTAEHYQSLKVIAVNGLKITLEEERLMLKEVVISNNLKHLNTISKIDLTTQPVFSSQDLLRKVPGLFIGQHAGGGKAEQIFLRGFDIDHGTDINISTDGMPVNMVSHAHGQGYADLHFLIPETISNIDFDKGPYFADKGDLTTAGYVAFSTKEALDKSTIGLDIGQYNTYRLLGMLNLLNNGNQSAYFASEYLFTDNYFDAPQNFSRINLFAKYSSKLDNGDSFSVSASHFTSKWDASGQIPLRAVEDGQISFYGAIDPTEGGNTTRSNFILQHTKVIDGSSSIKSNAYLSHYGFELYSNFTFYLNDPVNGDQIRQKEGRILGGFNSEYQKLWNVGDGRIAYKLGTGLRSDQTNDTELSHTVNRTTVLERLSLGDISQANMFGYTSADYTVGNWLMNAGLRYDYFKFGYENELIETYNNTGVKKGILSPKLNVMYTPTDKVQFFLKSGKGFHSNDTRVVVSQQGRKILPAAYSSDLGTVWKPFPNVIINAAIWVLYLEQEFVYVGDEAVVEPSGKTFRKGADLGLRWQLAPWLFFNSDFTYTHARSTESPTGEDYIPLAPITTLTAGLSVKGLKGFSGSIRSRVLGNRPANESYSVTAKGYMVTDATISYQLGGVSLGANIDNIFNVKWKETQFLTQSRLYNETSPVEEIHFTAGTPFNARLMMRYTF
ncbi:TonB-dependent receptor [Flavobacterium sp. RHBU_3]|uniref:TonB-dependent receptor n=1 Tax=Flavobacterium sp. RHBU_3 TaxID=3391184 RepID=UPI0039855DCD